MSEWERGSLALVNGNVFTADPDNPQVSAVGIRRGVIEYAGNDPDDARAAAGPGAEVIDLAGRSATPGLNDAHCHPILYGQTLRAIDLKAAATVAGVLDLVRERVAETPAGELVVGWGYQIRNIAEGRMPNRRELDAAAPDHAVILMENTVHEATTNSLGLNLIGYSRDTPDPEGGRIERDEQGEPTGVLVERASRPLMEVVNAPDRAPADLQSAIKSFLSFGITSVGEALVPSAEMFQLYQQVQADSRAARVRFNLMLAHEYALEAAESLGLMTGYGNRWLKAGPIKFFIDGTEEQRTAMLSEPYLDDPGNHGMWVLDPDVFKERVRRAHLAGWQCATHAIGDAAIELTLDAYAEAQEAMLRPDIRHRVEHASNMRPDLIQRMALEAIVPVPGARFISADYQLMDAVLGPERVRWYQPWNSWLERNVPAAISSDAPVFSPDPAINLWAIVNSRVEANPETVMQPEERISLEETLLAYTRNGAYASHEEQIKGTLRPGMLGDVAVFNTDLQSIDPLELNQVRVDMTIVDGTIAYQSG